LTPPSRTPCRTAAEPAAPTEPFDPSAIWALRLDPLTKLLLLAYAAQADATGRVLQPDRQEVTARTGLLPASVRSLTLALLERGLLTMLVQDDTDADAWGFRVTLGEGRA
jgi:hypothetical protein